MSLNEGIAFGTDGTQFETHTSKHHRLGQLLMLADGRKYRYSYAGGALAGLQRAVVSANFAPGCTGQANATGYEGAPSAAIAAGAVQVEFPDTTARVVDYYESGYLKSYPSGAYQTNRIRSSALGGGATVVVQLESAVQTAIGAAVQVTAYRSPYSNLVAPQAVYQEYEPFIGIPPVAVTSGRWFWLQTAGPCAAYAHGGTWPGSAAHYRDVFFHMNGTIDPASVTDPTNGFQRAGYLLSATVSGYGDIFIMLQLE